MIFADKLILLRKKSGWSQEELAGQMDVTRQSVSKWESAQSIPDLDRMIRLSEIFGVSLDYLLKDEIEETEGVNLSEDKPSVRKVSMEEANAFLSTVASTSMSTANAVFLCIISPICLLILAAVSEMKDSLLSENEAVGIGIIVLLLIIAAAVYLFIRNDSRTSSFSYLEKEFFETEYGVSGMVRERMARYKSTYTRNNIIGTVLCILAVIPLFSAIIYDEDNDFLMIVMVAVLLLIIAFGVHFFVRGGMIWESYEKLLQEGEYSRQKKKIRPIVSAVATAYWLTATAIFLGYSFVTDEWKYSWIIWPVAGVLYPAVLAILNIILNIFVKGKDISENH